MGNYFPVSSPATNYTFTAAGPVTGGDPVELVPGASGDGQAQRATGGGRYAGIAGQDAAPGPLRARWPPVTRWPRRLSLAGK